jgi:ABC-type protease/lipase transport system fused ATPase/permease subunit
MITKEELKMRTGYDSFRGFKRKCQGSSPSRQSIGLTRYLYEKSKVIELDIRPEELFMMADGEIAKKAKPRKPVKTAKSHK